MPKAEGLSHEKRMAVNSNERECGIRKNTEIGFEKSGMYDKILFVGLKREVN